MYIQPRPQEEVQVDQADHSVTCSVDVAVTTAYYYNNTNLVTLQGLLDSIDVKMEELGDLAVGAPVRHLGIVSEQDVLCVPVVW